MLAELATAISLFLLADLSYALDHYFVHRNARRYLAQHRPHHDFYSAGEAVPLFMPGETARYTASGFAAAVLGALLWSGTGISGFFIGGLAKWAHNYLFHVYQHRWAYRNHATNTEPMPATWGIASARYHQYHHDHPNRRPFTYAETWAGWDRILERLDPFLSPLTANHRRARRNANRRRRRRARERTKA